MPRATQDTARLRIASHTGLSPSMGPLSRGLCSLCCLPRRGPTTPQRPEPLWFGLFPVRSPLLGESFVYFLFLRVLRCFSSPRSPLTLSDSRPSTCWVVPFGNLRINGHLHLHGAYRSLSRPSSPPSAKASAMCPYLISYCNSLTIQGAEYTFSCKSFCNMCRRYARFEFYFSLVTICQITLWYTSVCVPKVENNGFEPLTPCVQSRCSSQLS